MVKRKKIFCAIILSILTVCVLAFLLQNGRKYPFSYSETSAYFPFGDGELLELAEGGTVYRYDKTGKRMTLLENSDIISLELFSTAENDGVSMLIVHKDGRLGICRDFSFEEREFFVGGMPIRKVKLYRWGLIALTENGDVYECEDTELYLKMRQKENLEIQLQKNENLPKCKDFATSGMNCALLTEDGQVMLRGKLHSSEDTPYEKIECPVVAERIYNACSALLVWSEDGYLYQTGRDMIGVWGLFDQFHLISEHRNVIQADTGFQEVVIVDSDSRVYHYHIGKAKGKGVGYPERIRIRNMKNVKKVILFDGWLYIFGEDYLYTRKVPSSP